jgi:hypothetical protein
MIHIGKRSGVEYTVDMPGERFWQSPEKSHLHFTRESCQTQCDQLNAKGEQR